MTYFPARVIRKKRSVFWGKFPGVRTQGNGRELFRKAPERLNVQDFAGLGTVGVPIHVRVFWKCRYVVCFAAGPAYAGARTFPAFFRRSPGRGPHPPQERERPVAPRKYPAWGVCEKNRFCRAGSLSPDCGYRAAHISDQVDSAKLIAMTGPVLKKSFCLFCLRFRPDVTSSRSP